MRTFPDVRMRALHALAANAQGAYENQAFKEAQAQYRELLRQLEALGLESAWAHWGLAISSDNLQELDVALNSIREALTMDPMCGTYQKSFDIIVRRVREHLLTAPAADASVPKLYRLLQQSGDVDVASHLAMARHYAVTQRVPQAEALLEALTLTAPCSIDLLRERARLARVKGDLAAAAGFEAEAQARAFTDVPFGIPTIPEE